MLSVSYLFELNDLWSKSIVSGVKKQPVHAGGPGYEAKTVPPSPAKTGAAENLQDRFTRMQTQELINQRNKKNPILMPQAGTY